MMYSSASSRQLTLISHRRDVASHQNYVAMHNLLPIYGAGAHRGVTASPPTDGYTTVNQQFGKQAFDQAEKLFKDARVPENVQAIAQQGVAASKEFYSKTAAAAQDGAKVMTEIADTAWGSTKMLNEK